MTIEDLKWLYTLNYSVLKVNLEEITPDESLFNPQPGGNCINWVVGHLLRSRQFILKLVNNEWNLPEGAADLYKRGSKGNTSELFLPFEQLLAMWDVAQTKLTEGLDSLSPTELAEETPPFGDFGKPDTRERRLLFLHFHESYHTGQLGLLRRLVGKEGAIR